METWIRWEKFEYCVKGMTGGLLSVRACRDTFSLLVAWDEQEHVAGRTIEIHLASANQFLPTIEYDNEVQMGANLLMHSPPVL